MFRKLLNKHISIYLFQRKKGRHKKYLMEFFFNDINTFLQEKYINKLVEIMYLNCHYFIFGYKLINLLESFLRLN